MVQKDTINGLQKLWIVLFNCAIADPVQLSVPQNDAKWLCICLFGHRFAYIYLHAIWIQSRFVCVRLFSTCILVCESVCVCVDRLYGIWVYWSPFLKVCFFRFVLQTYCLLTLISDCVIKCYVIFRLCWIIIVLLFLSWDEFVWCYTVVCKDLFFYSFSMCMILYAR